MFKSLYFVMPTAALIKRASVLIEARRFDEADQTIDRALARTPGDLVLLEQHSLSAHNSGRYSLACERWDRLRKRDPSHVMAWAGVACNERELGGFERASEVLLEAFDRFPKNELLLSEAHRLVRTMQPSAERTRLARILASSFTADLEQQERLIDLLLDLSFLAEAESVIAETRERFPDAPGPLERAGRLAYLQSDWQRVISLVDDYKRAHSSTPYVEQILDAAVHRLADYASNARFGKPAEGLACFALILRHEGSNPVWTSYLIDCLVKLGRLDEADRELRNAEQRFPLDGDIALMRAVLHAKREQWSEAITILEECVRQRPSDAHAKEVLAQTVAERAYHDMSPRAPEPRFAGPQDVGREEDAAKRELLLRFESIGEDCEFGLVQRRYGAEPIGLFRWNSTRVETLTTALQAKLSGLGSPEFTHMGIWDEVEYYLSDRRWGFGFHTFCSRNEVDYDTLYPKMCKRMVYLREKFLADMASATKTFIFKSDGATLEDLLILQAALGENTPAHLLCVKQLILAPSGFGIKPGEVFRIGNNLSIGYIARLGYDFPRWKILFDDWIAICGGVDAARPPPFAADQI